MFMSKHPKLTQKDLILYAPSPKVAEMVGKTFGRLTVLSCAGKRKVGKQETFYLNCLCECGKAVLASSNHVRGGKLSSCGCLKIDFPARFIHGEATSSGTNRSKMYTTWQSLRNRCNNPNDESYDRYGAIGRVVCEGWSGKAGFLNFKKAMTPITDKSIDRIDNNGNYSCGECDECKKNGWTFNCRWANDNVQSNNRGNFNKYIVVNGIRMNHRQADRYLGFPIKTISGRIARGWTEEEAVSVFPKMGNRKSVTKK